MIKSIKIRNFRSISSADVALAPITVLYGPTSSGKSTLLYAPLILRNFILNPNQQADGFFNLGFMNLGGYDACVFNHDQMKEVGIAIQFEQDGLRSQYGLDLVKASGTILLEAGEIKLHSKVAIPYPINQTVPIAFTENGLEFAINWNGITCTVAPKTPADPSNSRARELSETLNVPGEALKAIDIAPHRRGFFKPSYSPSAVSTTPTTEDEVASIIINDPNMAARISTYTEEIFGKDFRLFVVPGTATVFFQTTDKKSRIPVQLVNDGFGVNQIIYILAKLQRPEVRTVLVEEPEVHLHPTVVRNFVRAICDIVKNDNKQILLVTHSETLLSSILTQVSEGNLSVEDVRCYLTTRSPRSTVFEQQKVTKNGQLEGGLSSFVEAELEDLKRLLGSN